MNPIYFDVPNGRRVEQYERDTTPDSRYTGRECRFVMACIAPDGQSYRVPFITTISPALLEAAKDAVKHFTNSELRVLGTDHQNGRIIIQSEGRYDFRVSVPVESIPASCVCQDDGSGPRVHQGAIAVKPLP